MANKAKVTIECGTVDVHYRGVENPTLEAVYLQTATEAAKYDPIMRNLAQNGLGSDGTKISGI